MTRSRWWALVAALVMLFGTLAASPVSAKKKKPTPCGGRFVVEGARLTSAETLPADAIVVNGGKASTDGGCPPVKAKVQAKKKFTLVNAVWPACAGITGKVALKAKIESATCATITGRLKGKKAKLTRKFTARVQGPAGFTTSGYTAVTLASDTIGPAGGTIEITDPASPLFGLRLVVPPGAVDGPVTFEVGFEPITGTTGLPAGVVAGDKLIRITANGSDEWNQYRLFAKPVLVTLPYAGAGDNEETVRFYVVSTDGSLDPAGLEGQDPATDTLSFHLSAFGDTTEPSQLGQAGPRPASAGTTYATFVAVGLGFDLLNAFLGTPFNVDTGFLPSQNGWYVPNYGSYYKASRGGSCFGFVGAAKWYFQKHHAPGLYSNYHDPDDTETWVDDATAIEFTSRVHNGMIDIWDGYVTGELNLQEQSSRAVALSFLGGLYVTGAPVLLYIQQAIPQAGGNVVYSGAHAISIYRTELANGQFTFHVYDPNFPKNDDRRIVYGAAGFQSYLSGTDAASSNFQYNFLKHVGFHVGLSDAVLAAIKTAADAGFAGDSVFPTIEVTEVSGATTGTPATEGVTDEGEHKWVIDDKTVRIRGTILGGLAQNACCVVNNARFFLSNKKFSFPVNNAAGGGDGTFEAVIPIAQGENDLVILGAKASSFSNWAAFHRDVVESQYSPAALTVTLAWGQGQSDVDLYVREPEGESQPGDTVYYSHRKGTDAMHPFLDLDNTGGYGPEHYIALNGMTSLYQDQSPAPNLYGDYTVRVHYFSDHDGDSETTQPISWSLSWRYLAFCPDPCTDPESQGIWQEGGANGALGEASSGSCCNIDNGGGSWSEPYTIRYDQPDPDDFVIPDPPAVMLP